jgi:hypothetical protein
MMNVSLRSASILTRMLEAAEGKLDLQEHKIKYGRPRVGDGKR